MSKSTHSRFSDAKKRHRQNLRRKTTQPKPPPNYTHAKQAASTPASTNTSK